MALTTNVIYNNRRLQTPNTPKFTYAIRVVSTDTVTTVQQIAPAQSGRKWGVYGIHAFVVGSAARWAITDGSNEMLSFRFGQDIDVDLDLMNRPVFGTDNTDLGFIKANGSLDVYFTLWYALVD